MTSVSIQTTKDIELTPTGWTPTHELTESEWRAEGEALLRVARAYQWWVGDWLMYAKRYGDMYVEAMQTTGLELQTLKNILVVVNAIEKYRRRDNLSFSHHVEVAALLPPDQDRWLERAEVEHLSTRQLRAQIDHEQTHAAVAPPPAVELPDEESKPAQIDDPPAEESLPPISWAQILANASEFMAPNTIPPQPSQTLTINLDAPQGYVTIELAIEDHELLPGHEERGITRVPEPTRVPERIKHYMPTDHFNHAAATGFPMTTNYGGI